MNNHVSLAASEATVTAKMTTDIIALLMIIAEVINNYQPTM